MSDKGIGKGPQKDDSARRNKQQEVEQRQAGPQSHPVQPGLGEQAWVAAAGAYRRVSASPPSAIKPNDILTLQRTAGNRAVTQLLQAKLSVGPVGDKYEQEADRVAETVLRMPTPASESTPSNDSVPSERPLHERFEEEEEIAQPKLTIQRAAMAPPVGNDDDGDGEAEDTQNDIQRAGTGDGSFQPGHDFEHSLSRASGGGVPLSEVTQNFMEPRFGANFGNVRVHTDKNAVQMNQEFGAQAFTHGSDVFFGAGKYDPGTTAGKRLLGHELTHVVQQGGTVSTKSAQPAQRSKTKERELNNLGSWFTTDASSDILLASSEH